MMTQSGQYLYAETDEVQAVALNYANGDITMHVLLPRPGTELTPSVWSSLAQRFEHALVRLTLPRFSATCELDLVPQLSQIGIGEVFRPGADFSRMGLRGSFISAFVTRPAWT